MKVLILLIAAANWLSAATLVYSKSFPGSSPAFVSIKLESNGDAEFNDSPTGDNAMRFKMSEADTKTIFDLAEKLGYFTRPLESGLKVAFMGEKKFRYEDGTTNNEQKFNYSTEPEAQQEMILEKLKLTLPPQPPPRIRAGQLELAGAKPG